MIIVKNRKKALLTKKQRNDLIFYVIMAALPITQFAIFYIGVNINSILLAFKNYSSDGGFSFIGLGNIKNAFSGLFSDPALTKAAANSFLFYAISLLVGTTLAVLFSFYIYKKMYGHKFFKVILFLPSIISSIAMVIVFSNFVERVVPEALMKILKLNSEPDGLLANPKTTLGTIFFYNIWIGFGVNVLMYSGAMSNISDSVVEAARLDGASNMQEFVHITLPCIYPTFITFIVVGVASIFTSQLNLFSFYQGNAEIRLYTFGYYLFKNTQQASISDFPSLSALGIVFTIIAVPLTFIVKALLQKFGPKTD